MKFVIIESPYGSDDPAEVLLNEAYATACARDCLARGEVPFASHLFFTRPGLLDDRNPAERAQGIAAGLEIAKRADLTAFYCDRGFTPGMQTGCDSADLCGRPTQQRTLGGIWARA